MQSLILALFCFYWVVGDSALYGGWEWMKDTWVIKNCFQVKKNTFFPPPTCLVWFCYCQVLPPHILGPLKVHLCERASHGLLHGSNQYRVASFHLTQLFRKETKPQIYQSLAQLLSERHHPATDGSKCRDSKPNLMGSLGTPGRQGV